MKKLYKIILICSSIALVMVIYINIPEQRKTIKTQHFTFLFSSSIDSLDIVELSKTLEGGSYSKISSNLNTLPAENIEVNIYAQRWRYGKATGHWGPSGSVEGTSKLHFIANSWLISETSNIAIHEFVHAVFLKLLIDREPQPLNAEKFDKKFSNYPIWLWEGVSAYEANEFYDPNTLPYLSNGQYPQISELNVRTKGKKIYTCGYTIIEYILKEYGRDKLIELIESYGDLEKVLGVSEKQFSKDWYKFISTKYLK